MSISAVKSTFLEEYALVRILRVQLSAARRFSTNHYRLNQESVRIMQNLATLWMKDVRGHTRNLIIRGALPLKQVGACRVL